MNKRIAILGATSHIAKGLISNFAKDTKYKLFLFAVYDIGNMFRYDVDFNLIVNVAE